MDNLIYTINECSLKFAQFAAILNDQDPAQGWKKFGEVMRSLLPVLWIASALVSTFWLIFRLVKTIHKGGEADDQGEYEKMKSARKRALVAWLFGLCWPVILMLVWPLVPALGKVFGWTEAYQYWPSLF